jgi:hypothetical protein
MQTDEYLNEHAQEPHLALHSCRTPDTVPVNKSNARPWRGTQRASPPSTMTTPRPQQQIQPRSAPRAAIRHLGPATALFLCTLPTTAGSLDITYTLGANLSAQQISLVPVAVATWESLLQGYQPGISIPAVHINVYGVPMSEAGDFSTILADANPNVFSTQAGFTLATAGYLAFNSAYPNPLSNSKVLGLIEHEIAHVLGFGTLWTQNGLYNPVGAPGEYTGNFALAAWRTEFNQPAATYVPVELDGGVGTMDIHWNEVDGGKDPTGFLDALSRDMRDEVMTGWIAENTFISRTTLGAFRDLGFTPVPEPRSVALGLSVTCLGVAFLRRRRCRSQRPE